MKNRNRKILFTAVMLIVVTVLSLLCFTACGDKKGKGDVTVVIAYADGAQEYYVSEKDVDGEGVMPIMLYLKEKKGLNFVTTESPTYGTFVNEVGGLKPDATKHEFISIHTSVAKDKDVSKNATTVEYKGTTLTSTGVGISTMSVEPDAIIYFVILTYIK